MHLSAACVPAQVDLGESDPLPWFLRSRDEGERSVKYGNATRAEYVAESLPVRDGLQAWDKTPWAYADYAKVSYMLNHEWTRMALSYTGMSKHTIEVRPGSFSMAKFEHHPRWINFVPLQVDSLNRDTRCSDLVGRALVISGE